MLRFARGSGEAAYHFVRQYIYRALRDESYGGQADMRVARRFVIGGSVQGVGFRYFAQNAAAREGVTGWVHNLPDGRVEAFVEGDKEAVTRFEHAIRSGPPGARIENVDAHDEEATEAFKTFRIK
jgi:acylphosphatase